ncbi:vomeronasal type-2 receptor 26-like [Rana temporaria]|uniref:vomeronasal type-2 receptor 26-like n=1 Tax=Rana temporaria TaxID=8407 RepID=UPI001AACEC7E|nr:vomeronasal type-2 receptor 26-like [Rana temporaria]
MSSVMDGFLVPVVLYGLVSILQGQSHPSRDKKMTMCHLISQSPVFEYKYYQRGDVMIGGLVTVHTTATTTRSKNIAFYNRIDISEYEYLMGFFFAIDEINKDPDLLPNITLGYHLFDTCGYIMRAIDSTLQILTGGGMSGVPNYWGTKNSEVAGFVGDATFPSTLAVAELLNIYQYPQISHRVTDPLLSDREKFPNFYRTVASNWLWYAEVIEFLKMFGWNWVGIITSSDGTGETELRELRKEMTRHGICIEFVVYLTSDVEITNRRVRVIEKSTTDVVIVCGHFIYEYILFSKESKVLRQNMTLIVNPSWNVLGYPEISLKETFNCSIVAIFPLYYIPGFDDFMCNVHPSKRPDDPLLEDIWISKFNCPSSNIHKNNVFLSGVCNITCTGPESLGYRFTRRGDGKFYFIYIAVYALAHALNNMRLRRNKSGNYGIRKKVALGGFDFQTMLDQYLEDVGQLHRYVRTVQFKNSHRQDVIFNERGELPSVFTLANMVIFDTDTNDWEIKMTLVEFTSDFSNSKTDRTAKVSYWKQGKVPQARCSDPCPPGSRKVPTEGVHICCYHCVPCSDGEISNKTDSDICHQCPVDTLPDKRKITCIPKTYDYLSYETNIIALAFYFISILCSVETLSILTLFIIFRDTPIVKANNRTVSFILLTAILLSFLCVFFFLGRPVDITCMVRQISFGIFFSIAVSSVLAKTITVCIAFRASKPGSYWRKWVGEKTSNSVVIIGSSVQVVICVVWLSVSPPYQEYDMDSYPGKIIIQCNEGSVIGFYSMLGYMGLLAAVSFLLAFMVRTFPDSFNEAKYITFSMLVFCSVWISMIPAYLSTRGKYMVAVEVFAILTSSAGLLGCIFFPKCYIIIIQPQRNTRKHIFNKVKS